MEAVSCGGVVIYKDKILILYKNIIKRYDAWVLPKGTVEKGESYEETALREVMEESGVHAKIQAYIGKSHYNFRANNVNINKTVHWYLMSANSYYSTPQAEEFFLDSGYYKYNVVKFLLKYNNECDIMKMGYEKYKYLRSNNKWPKYS